MFVNCSSNSLWDVNKLKFWVYIKYIKNWPPHYLHIILRFNKKLTKIHHGEKAPNLVRASARSGSPPFLGTRVHTPPHFCALALTYPLNLRIIEGKYNILLLKMDWILVGLVHVNTSVWSGPFWDSELHYQTRAGILNLDAPCLDGGGRATAQTNKQTFR